MTPVTKPMVDQPIEENLRRVYGTPQGAGAVSADMPLPARLSRLLDEMARRHGGAPRDEGRG